MKYIEREPLDEATYLHWIGNTRAAFSMLREIADKVEKDHGKAKEAEAQDE